MNLPSGGAYLGVNSAKFNALPANYKKVLLEEAKVLEQGLKNNWETTLNEKIGALWKKGVTLLKINATGRASWQNAAGPIWDKWAKEDSRNQEALRTAKKALGI